MRKYEYDARDSESYGDVWASQWVGYLNNVNMIAYVPTSRNRKSGEYFRYCREQFQRDWGKEKKKRILTNIADNVSRNLEDAAELASKKGIGRNQGPVYQRETDDESEEAG